MTVAVSDIGHFLCFVRSDQMSHGLNHLAGPVHSSVTSIAISGQLVWASHALSSSPAGTEPSPISWALPNSSRLNSSGASDLQRAWPWHLSWSTRIFSFPDMAGVPLVSLALYALYAFL